MSEAGFGYGREDEVSRAEAQQGDVRPIILGTSTGQRTGLVIAEQSFSMDNVVMVLLPIILIVAIIRYNPQLVPCLASNASSVRRGTLPSLSMKAMPRPRPRGYDRVAVIEPTHAEADSPRTKCSVPQRPQLDEMPAERMRPRSAHTHPRSVNDATPGKSSMPTDQSLLHESQRRVTGRVARAPTPGASNEAAQELQPPPKEHRRRPQPPVNEVSGKKQSIFSPGMQVRVVDLVNAPQHNGNEAVLIAPMRSSERGDRWNLRMLSGELLALKPENLQPSKAAPSVSKMIEALERAGEHDKAALLRSVLPDAEQ